MELEQSGAATEAKLDESMDQSTAGSDHKPIFTHVHDSDVIDHGASPFWVHMGESTAGLEWENELATFKGVGSAAASPVSSRSATSRPMFGAIDLTPGGKSTEQSIHTLEGGPLEMGVGGEQSDSCDSSQEGDNVQTERFAPNRLGNLGLTSFAASGDVSCPTSSCNTKAGDGEADTFALDTQPSLNCVEDSEGAEMSDAGTSVGQEGTLTQLVADLKSRFNLPSSTKREVKRYPGSEVCESDLSKASIQSPLSRPFRANAVRRKQHVPRYTQSSSSSDDGSNCGTEIYEEIDADGGDGLNEDMQKLNICLERNGFSSVSHAVRGDERQRRLISSFMGVLEQYIRKDELARNLMRDGESWMKREKNTEAEIGQLCAERDRAMKEANKHLNQLNQERSKFKQELAKEKAMGVKMESQSKKLQSRIGELEKGNKAKEKELSALKRQASMSEKNRKSSTTEASRASESMKNLEGQVHQMSHQVHCLNVAIRSKDAEITKLQASSSPMMTPANKSREKDAISRLESEIQRLRGLLKENGKEKDKEINHLNQSCTQSKRAASQWENDAKAAQERAAKLGNDLKKTQRTNSELQQQCRVHEEEINELQQKVKQYSTELQNDRELLVSSNKRTSHLESDLMHARNQFPKWEELLRSKEQELSSWQTAALEWDRKVSIMEERASKAESQNSRIESDLQRWKQRAADLEVEKKDRVAELEARLENEGALQGCFSDANDRAKRAEEESEKAKQESQQLKQLNSKLEHSLRSTELTVQKLKERMKEKLDKEERRLQNDKETYGRIRHAYTSTKNKLAARAGAVAKAARQLRPVEIVSIYETSQESMESELASLHAEVRVLSNQLKDAQNALAAKERAGACRSMNKEQIMVRIDVAEKRVSELLRELNSTRAQAADAQREAARQKGESERRLECLTEENSSLLLELEARPTVKDMKSAQRQVELMERRLMKASQSGDAGGAAEAGELGLGIGSSGVGLLTTKQRIDRDKDLHRLGLHVVENMPKDVLVYILQDVCVSLDLNDATRLPSSILKLVRVVESLPQLEAFVGKVCEVVFKSGAMFLPQNACASDPCIIPNVLRGWIDVLAKQEASRQAIESIRRELLRRVDGESRPMGNLSDLVEAVGELIQHERKSLMAVETIQGAHSAIVADPATLLHRIVGHFQKLFDCPNLEGVIPAMNKVYMAVTESRNFLRSLSGILGFETEHSIAACLNRVRDLLDQHGRTVDLKAEYKDILRCAGKENVRNAGNGPSKNIGAPKQEPQSAVAEFKDSILAGLIDTFKLADIGQIMKHAEKLVDRLNRLDEVMPKYQKMTAELYEILRIRTMEEIVPAVHQIVSSQ
ncbi:hypothetical protein BSKO_00774 [Bryopsis sp. KO-2023]|nr:hypothetical protein BSKO_00774 [Bryopsis sp. KO-2023]